jgi:hypothetical protein
MAIFLPIWCFLTVGRYNAIVVGSRKISRLQQVFMGSVSANLVEHSEFIPVWIVDGEVTPDKIMVAVDGSEIHFEPSILSALC